MFSSSFILFRSSVNHGDLVVCHGIEGFPSNKMAGRVIKGDRPARPGMAWVREVRGLGDKPKGWTPFVIEWPVSKLA
jgi:hypothetical protein